jgi:hypothetical protein
MYNFFKNYSFLSLNSPSPLTRTNGLKIINEIARWDFIPVL